MGLYEKSKAKKVLSNRLEIKDLVTKTMDDMATIVGATLGPGGRAVLIERDGLSPLITKDGVTVARSLGVDNAEANLIIESAKEICLNTAKEAGDGTTTAIVLANAIVKHGLDFLNSNPKYNPQRMVTELNTLYNKTIVPFLKENADLVANPEELIDVATISANGDKQIAEIAVEAVLSAGEDGKVLIEEAQGNQLRVETIDGFIVTTGLKDVGAIGYAFINDKSNQQAKMDDGLVFLYDGTLNDLKVPAAIQQAIEQTDYYGKPIIVVAQGFSDVVLDKFAKTAKGGYMIVPVKTPMYGIANSASMFLHDLAAYSGAKVYDPGNLSQFIEEDEEEGFGHFNNAKINMYECFITNDFSSEAVEQRVGELKAIAEVAKNDFDRMHIKAAIARLTGGVATIWVGGSSELEAREKKARIEDAVEAVKSAIAEGIVPGGCAMQLVMADMISSMLTEADAPASWSIMAKALRAPFELLLTNCGEDVNDVWMALQPHIAGKKEAPSMIFDANLHRVVDPITGGIIEPAKVCRVTIGNALSVASLLITLGGLVVVPRDSSLENQLALSKQAFRDMMAGGDVGQP